MTQYEKPPELYAGLRLHQNEHTGGCSPKVIDALARELERKGRCTADLLTGLTTSRVSPRRALATVGRADAPRVDRRVLRSADIA